MEKAKVLEKLIRESGFTVRGFAKKCDIPESTIYTILKKGVGRASVNNIITICKNLGITIEELESLSENRQEEQAYEQMEVLIARNGKKLTPEEKMHLIKLLSENEK